MDDADEVLIARVAEGDVGAFEGLYQRHAPRLHGWAVHSIGAARADDALQEVFLLIWRHAVQFDPARGPFSAWVTAIARHFFLGEIRRAGRQAQRMAVESSEAALLSRPDSLPPLEDLAARAEDAQLVLRSLQGLPAEQRRVIVMAYFGGFRQTEIAAFLGVPLGTVKTRIRLAMQRLRAALLPDEEALEEPKRLRVVAEE